MSPSSGEGEGIRPSGERSSLPRPRPRWLVVVSFLTLLVGARFFLASLSDMRKLATGKVTAAAMVDSLHDAQKELIVRGQWAVEDVVDRAHPVLAWGHAAARFVLAAVLLFAVSAVFSDDVRSRGAALLGGWGTIFLCVGNAAFVLFVARSGLSAAVQAVQQVAADVYARAGAAPPAPGELADQAHVLMVHVPMFASALGVGFGLLLVMTFGGRRGRLFYNREQQGDYG